MKDYPGVMAGINRNMPALSAAGKIQRRAASVGFDWNKTEQVLDKIQEEIEENRNELKKGENKKRIMEEIGDLFFACVNYARHVDVDPEIALRRSNDKFVKRFQFIEEELARAGKYPEGVPLDELEDLWQKAKMMEE